MRTVDAKVSVVLTGSVYLARWRGLQELEENSDWRAHQCVT